MFTTRSVCAKVVRRVFSYYKSIKKTLSCFILDTGFCNTNKNNTFFMNLGIFEILRNPLGVSLSFAHIILFFFLHHRIAVFFLYFKFDSTNKSNLMNIFKSIRNQ